MFVHISGFLPSQTAKHHQANVLAVLRQALDEAGVKAEQIDAIAYTKGTRVKIIVVLYNG